MTQICKNLTVAVKGVAIASILGLASCASTPYRNGTPVAIPAQKSTWSMNMYEREAQKKAIAQDMPYSTIHPSAY